jgi:large subunit ribosomal protein L29
MKTMLASDLRKNNVEHLLKLVSELKHELMNLRFQKSSSQLEKPVVLRVIKKNIARVKTVLVELKVTEKE